MPRRPDLRVSKGCWRDNYRIQKEYHPKSRISRAKIEKKTPPRSILAPRCSLARPRRRRRRRRSLFPSSLRVVVVVVANFFCAFFLNEILSEREKESFKERETLAKRRRRPKTREDIFFAQM